MKIVKTILKYLFTLILAVVILAVGLIYIFEKGPSDTIRGVYVSTVMQSSAAKFTARFFLDQETVDAIVNASEVEEEGKMIDPGLIQGGGEDFDLTGVRLEEIATNHYRGFALIVNDPSRLYVYSIPSYGGKGQYLIDMVKADDALGGVNGGGFSDSHGSGTGGVPLGIIISDGKWLNGSKTSSHKVIGFTYDNVLVCGKYTAEQISELNLRDAVEWGPALIVNGEPKWVSGNSDGANPRTAIGQKPDGSVILVAIEGRQIQSIGATYNDLIQIMLDYGCVTAGNLDGGLSTGLVYEGQDYIQTYSSFGARRIPTAILVKR